MMRMETRALVAEDKLLSHEGKFAQVRVLSKACGCMLVCNFAAVFLLKSST